MSRIVVTAGEKFTDIDVLACAISYNELLQKLGKNSICILPGELNKSVTPTIRSWELPHETKFKYPNADFVIVDISQPEHLAKFVVPERIIELYDHHFGYEKVWKKLTKGKIVIEPVGACTTLIWEKYEKNKMSKKISKLSARLICYATVSNTLNFKSSVTNKRDIDAYHKVLKYADLKNDWIGKYFSEQDKAVYKNPVKEIKNDTHVENFPNKDEKLIIGQLELWDSRNFVKDHKDDIEEALISFGSENWFLTPPSISEGKNYIYTKSKKVQKLLMNKLPVTFTGDLGITKKLFLRKEIKKIIYNY
ncbi:DHH family phosphoesterase [Candidatus Woesebacteria bacterium]|nr:DHH family phosphoesterase [Candidatus Woesebacteria bacterium]